MAPPLDWGAATSRKGHLVARAVMHREAVVGGRRAVGRPLPVAFSGVLAVAVLVATVYGLVAGQAYPVSPGVSETWPDVARGQDLLTLLTVPVLLWAATKARAGSLHAHLFWLGLVLYYAYTYVMYAFAPYNDAFLSYVAIMGLASYGLLDGLLRLEVRVVAQAFAPAPRRAAAWYLVGITVLFLGLWLAMILPAIPGDQPAEGIFYDIPSAVHVLDLAFVLPLLIATGRMLLRGHPAGVALAGTLMSMKAVLAFAMLSMSFTFMDAPNLGEAVLWAVIAVVSVAWLVVGSRRSHRPDGPWLRGSLWE